MIRWIHLIWSSRSLWKNCQWICVILRFILRVEYCCWSTRHLKIKRLVPTTGISTTQLVLQGHSKYLTSFKYKLLLKHSKFENPTLASYNIRCNTCWFVTWIPSGISYGIFQAYFGNCLDLTLLHSNRGGKRIAAPWNPESKSISSSELELEFPRQITLDIWGFQECTSRHRRAMVRARWSSNFSLNYKLQKVSANKGCIEIWLQNN